MHEIRNSGSESENPGRFFFRRMKLAVCRQIPSTLRLVENHNMFHRRAGVDQRIVAKVMNVLDESFDALGNFPLSHSNADSPLTCNLVTRECFAEHGDERTVP